MHEQTNEPRVLREPTFSKLTHKYAYTKPHKMQTGQRHENKRHSNLPYNRINFSRNKFSTDIHNNRFTPKLKKRKRFYLDIKIFYCLDSRKISPSVKTRKKLLVFSKTKHISKFETRSRQSRVQNPPAKGSKHADTLIHVDVHTFRERVGSDEAEAAKSLRYGDGDSPIAHRFGHALRENSM